MSATPARPFRSVTPRAPTLVAAVDDARAAHEIWGRATLRELLALFNDAPGGWRARWALRQ